MRVYDGASLMTLVISTECANPPTLVGGSLVMSIITSGIVSCNNLKTPHPYAMD